MAREPDAVKTGQKRSCHTPPHSLAHAANVVSKYINLRPTLRIAAGFRNNLVLAGIGSLTLAALAPLPTLAAPGITLLDSFTGSGLGNGSNPQASLTSAGNGRFYGTASGGGANDLGTIFEFDSATGGITLKASFTGAGSGNGTGPTASLTSAGNGKFYGTASGGGANNLGSIFEFDPSTGDITLKASFTGFGPGNGSNPLASLTSAGNGKFYGTAYEGGANNLGSIFEFDPATSDITLKYSFTDAQGIGGANPNAALTPSGNGTFYGTTLSGGADCNLVANSCGGTLFEFDPATGSITNKASFLGFNGIGSGNGAFPLSDLTPTGNGKFYGTTYFGGTSGYGTIYEFDPASGGVTIKASFVPGSGRPFQPWAALTPSGDGKFYGTSVQGGVNNRGSIYEFDPASGGITLKASFTNSIGTRTGVSPIAALTPAANGKFYALATFGGANNQGTIVEFDPGTDSVPTPTPLPLMGAGAAFGWSRRLRRRIQPVRPVFPIGR